MRLRKEGWRVLYVDIDAITAMVWKRLYYDPSADLSLHMDASYAYRLMWAIIRQRHPQVFSTINVPLHEERMMRVSFGV